MEPPGHLQETGGAEWKSRLLDACGEAVGRLPDDPPLEGFSGPDAGPPSLYSFFEEVAVLRNELRAGNRRAAETFAKFGEVLEGMREDSGKLRERLAGAAEAQSQPVGARRIASLLVEIIDRIGRLESAARAGAEGGWMARLGSRGRWVRQAEGLAILHDHLRELLAREGVERIDAAPGERFDPHFMKAVGRESARESGGGALVVSEEILPGYRFGEECLRPAEVRVANASASHE